MRAVYMGTSEFARPSLRALCAVADVTLVVTQPDRPRGRGRIAAPPPVKEEARGLDRPVWQPERLGESECRRVLEERPDIVVVAAYGRLLPAALLAGPRYGCINVHASLLPRYRGAAPIVWAIARGERETGVSIMQMDEGLDSGPVLLRRAVPIADEDTGGAMEARLAALGADALRDVLVGLERGKFAAEPQDHTLATRAPKVNKDDAHVRFDVDAVAVRDLVRAMDPRPGAFVHLVDEPIRVFSPRVVERDGAAGTVLGSSPEGLVVACASRAVAFGELQLAGRKRLAAVEVLRGRSIAPGTRLS